MGLIRGSVTLANPTRPELVPLPVSALADTGAVHLCIPEHLAIQLELAELERREVVLADGRRRTVPYVGPVEVRFGSRRCFTGAMVLGTEVLLGAIPMEDMDLVLRPQLQSLEVNPESPNLPTSVAMRVKDRKHRAPVDAGSASNSRWKLSAIPAAVLGWQTGRKTDALASPHRGGSAPGWREASGWFEELRAGWWCWPRWRKERRRS